MKVSYENMKCVWMSSGVVEYKLCDKDFDCENCPFDKVIRNLSDRSIQNDQSYTSDINNDLIYLIIKNIESEKFENYLITLNNHLILKNFFPNRYYIGIDPLMRYLFDETTSILFCTDRKTVKRGTSIFRISGEWGDLNVISPVDFILLEKINNNDNKHDIKQWLGIIETSEDKIDKCRVSESDFRGHKDFIVNYLSNYVKGFKIAGQTMHDGGRPVKFLHQRIGRESYIQLLYSLFTNH